MRRALFLLILVSFFVFPPALLAQNAGVGASYTWLSLAYPDRVAHGLGGWFTWDVSDAGATAGLDVGITLFPDDDPLTGRQAQFLAGARAGIRTAGFSVFGRVRPGVAHFGRRFFAPDVVCILIFPPPESCLVDSNNLALDVGATVEVYPTPRSLLRLDIGDTMLRFAREGQDPVWKHNLQLMAGGGLRF